MPFGILIEHIPVGFRSISGSRQTAGLEIIDGHDGHGRRIIDDGRGALQKYLFSTAIKTVVPFYFVHRALLQDS